jgi:hypothetical protein
VDETFNVVVGLITELVGIVEGVPEDVAGRDLVEEK